MDWENLARLAPSVPIELDETKPMHVPHYGDGLRPHDEGAKDDFHRRQTKIKKKILKEATKKKTKSVDLLCALGHLNAAS